MTDLDAMDLFSPRDADPVPTPPRHIHTYARTISEVQRWGVPIGRCRYCERTLDEATARRGKSARARGNAFEREVAAKLGGRRVGQYGDQVDVDVPGYLRVQAKNGVAYPARIDRWLRAIPVQAGLLRAVVLGDAPGPGNRRRALIVFDLDEYAMWHGKP